MRLSVALLLGLGTASTAQAQTWEIHGEVLAPDSTIPFASESIGGPSVVYDTIHDRFVMVFEARTPTTDSRCPQGIWALGLATSTDGISWTMDSNPLLLPVPGSGDFYSCVAAHPAVVFTENGNGRLQVFFKAEEDTDSCKKSGFATCPYTGIGRMRVDFDKKGDVSTTNIQSTVVRQLDGPGGFPSVVLDGITFKLAYQTYPNVRVAESVLFTSFPVGSVVFDVNADFSSGETGDTSDTGDTESGPQWVFDEFFSPSIICDDSFLFPDAMWVGSRDTRFGAVLEGGWGKGLKGASSSADWILSEAAGATWTNDDDWRHWEMLRLSTGDYLTWFSEKDASGDNSIHFGGTTLTFNNSDVESRICP
ncbi:MAG: hypothetical protein KTR31_17065 [Myxococcales bacterium]|nr:hypothetical protein [Myxococcales bacterium]